MALPPGVSAQCYYFDDEPFFGGDPHPPPYLYFDEDVLVSLVIWGQLGCPVTTPDINHVGDLKLGSQHEGCQLGRWTVVSDHDNKKLGLNRNHVGVFFEKDKIAERLRGIRIKYGQFATGKSWLWLLTDERVGPPPSCLRHEWGLDPLTVRLGRWPD